MSGFAKGLVVPAALLLGAEGALRLSGVQSDAVAPPSAVLEALLGALRDGSMMVATGQTLYGAVAGLALGGAAGLSLGILLGLFRPLDRLLEVTVEAIRPVPSIALIPIALLALGFGPGMEISIVAFSCTWPILILTRAAVAGIEPQLLEVARALGLSFRQRVIKIVLPAAFPRLIVAIRLAVGVALVVAVTVEVAADPRGLGNAIMVAEQALQPALMLAYLVWIGLLGVGLNALLTVAQRALLDRAAVPDVPS